MQAYQTQVKELGDQAKQLQRQITEENVHFHGFVSEIFKQIAKRSCIRRELRHIKVEKRKQDTLQLKLRKSIQRKAMYRTRQQAGRESAVSVKSTSALQHKAGKRECVARNATPTMQQGGRDSTVSVKSTSAPQDKAANRECVARNATCTMHQDITDLPADSLSVRGTIEAHSSRELPGEGTESVAEAEIAHGGEMSGSNSPVPVQRTRYSANLSEVTTDVTYRPEVGRALMPEREYIWSRSSEIEHDGRQYNKGAEYTDEVVNAVPRVRMEAAVAVVPFDTGKAMDVSAQINVGYVCVACPGARRHTFKRHCEVKKHVRNLHFFPHGFRCRLCKQTYSQRGHVMRHLKSHVKRNEIPDFSEK